MIATDHRPRDLSVADAVARVHARGRLALADCATFEEEMAAATAGADLVASTLSGYTGGGPEPVEPETSRWSAGSPPPASPWSPRAVSARRSRPAPREGGAVAVAVGSGITRPEHVTRWFVDALGATG